MKKYTIVLLSQTSRPKKIEADKYVVNAGLLEFYVGESLVFATAVSNVAKLSEGDGK